MQLDDREKEKYRKKLVELFWLVKKKKKQTEKQRN